MKLKTTDYLRIIADRCSTNDNAIQRVDSATKYASIVQHRLTIPDDFEVSVGILAVLFCNSRLNSKVPFHRLKLKMGLLEITNVQEDFIYLLNNGFVELGKSSDNIEWIRIKSKLHLQLYNNMTDGNRNLFLMLFGKELNEPQLKFLKSKLFNKDLDISELFRTAVVCGQLDAAKEIINCGFNINKEFEAMAYELLICANYSSKFCLDFYLTQGLKITDNLIAEMLKLAEEHQDHFEIENTYKLIEKLKLKMVKE